MESNSYLQFLTVLVIFIVVLGITVLTLRWISGYQKVQRLNCNIEVVETARIANNKYIQIVRVGLTYMVIAVSRDQVTMLGEVPFEQLTLVSATGSGGKSFKELLDGFLKKDSSDDGQPKE
ncbi:MAG: flagellar biosynthetic protein FliO [Acetatifactor sp.]|jgi:flagellar protein FliO/FliZ|nr:flagellar biosynthetic protein FliO [Acetatifactor sp.]